MSKFKFDSKIEKTLTKRIKELNIEQLRQGISIRRFNLPLVSRTQLLSSLTSSFVGLKEKKKLRSFYHTIRLLEHMGYRTLLPDDKDKIDGDSYAWLTLLQSSKEKIVDISSFKVTGVNINSLDDGIYYLDFDSEIALADFTAQVDVAVTDWHFSFADEEVSALTDHIIGQCPLVSYYVCLNQWHLDSVKNNFYGGAVVGGIRIINECFPIIEIYFHDKEFEQNIPENFVRWYPSGSVMWIELHKSKEYYLAYIDLLRNEYPISATYDTRTKWLVDINAGFMDVGWAHH